MALAQAPINLDPRYASDAASERINHLIYRPLVDFDERFRPQPALADWQLLSTTHYRFTLLQERSSFHDGSTLDSADVAATYGSLLALKDSPHTAEFANIQSIKVVDENTVDFILHEADDIFPSRLIIGILPAEKVEAGHDFSRQPVGSGPLRFLAWQGVLQLERLADGQRFTLQEVKDPTVRVLKLLRGEVDLLQGDLLPELVRYLKQQPEIRVDEVKGSNFSYLGFNLQDAQLAKLEVRRAIAHAIDREALLHEVLVGGSREAGSILPPEHWAGHDALPAYEYNPALARELLQQAGVELPLKLAYKTSTDAQRVRLATVLQAQLREVGIALEILSLDWGTFFDDVKHGKFQLYGLTWVGIRTPEIYRLAFHSESVPPKGANRGRFQDAVTDQLIAQGDWRAVSERVHTMLPYVPLWYEGQFVATRSNISDYQVKADGSWDGLATVKKTVEKKR
ncbi:MAG: peptide ABC transporter substrate-binding protein [Betaproteobacteria bacterium HGW-Betaproteobacteria-15]|nr:MAG: peptide ABC transporter substrate-binding protein [Betaproteobacteria bacterium HGW-Betaproteobacteria-15]